MHYRPCGIRWVAFRPGAAESSAAMTKARSDTVPVPHGEIHTRRMELAITAAARLVKVGP
jgi:hypothetical protein